MKRAILAMAVSVVLYVAAVDLRGMFEHAGLVEHLNGSDTTYRVLYFYTALAHNLALLWAVLEWAGVGWRVMRGRKQAPVVTRG